MPKRSKQRISFHQSKKQNSQKYFVIKKVKKYNFWSKDEDDKLLKICEQYDNTMNWKEISTNFSNKNPMQCSARFLKIKPGIKHGHWLEEEDQLILKLYGLYGQKWAKIAKKMENRTGKQVRDRFVNYLDESVTREKFTSREDKTIKNLYIKYGPKWSKIAKFLPGRTADIIKNRFYSFLKSKIHIYERKSSQDKFLNDSLPRLILKKRPNSACNKIHGDFEVSSQNFLEICFGTKVKNVQNFLAIENVINLHILKREEFPITQARFNKHIDSYIENYKENLKNTTRSINQYFTVLKYLQGLIE